MSNFSSSEIKFTEKQSQAIDYVLHGKNVFITGPSGTGKSLTVHSLRNLLEKMGKTIGVTSTTGVSAILIDGATLHSFLGIGLGQDTVEDTIKQIRSRANIRMRWVDTDVLFVDEISMLSPELFGKLNKIAKSLRGSMRPFGGMQLVLSGDFLQLPVVKSSQFCFESEAWKECVHHTIHLTEIMRQSDTLFQSVLNKVRFGTVDDEVKTVLNDRVEDDKKKTPSNPDAIMPTRIYTTNAIVDYENDVELQKLCELTGECYTYEMKIAFTEFKLNTPASIEKYKKNILAPAVLDLCVGAQVMLLMNLDVGNGLANGSRGVVTGFVGDFPKVKFMSGMELVISPEEWQIKEGKKTISKITQVPLKLAWCITTHKCVDGDTLVYTNTGMKRIRELDAKDSNILTVKDGEVLSTEFTSVHAVEDSSVFTLTTNLGFQITGSRRHPVWVYSGSPSGSPSGIWKLLPEIRPGDLVYLHTGISYTIDNKEETKNTQPIVRDFSKPLPQSVLSLDTLSQTQFLISLIRRSFTNPEHTLTACNRFITDIQVLLLNRGIVASVERGETDSTLTLTTLQYLSLKTADNIFKGKYYDVVQSVTETCGQVTLYDITVPATASFLSDGFLSHNSQGCTLDYAIVDLANCFEFGQAYVALSRVKNLEGLIVKNVVFDKIQAHPKAVEFYENLAS